MGFMAKMSARNIENIGISFGIKDVTPSESIYAYNENLFIKKNEEAKNMVQEFRKKYSHKKDQN